MPRFQSTLFALAVLVATGCVDGDGGSGGGAVTMGGQTGSEVAGCLAIERQDIDVDADAGELPELGFQPREVFDFSLGGHELALDWEGRDDAELSLQLESDAAPEFVRFENCEDRAELLATLTMTSSDGLLAETLEVLLTTNAQTHAEASVTLDLGALAGSFELTGAQRMGFDHVAVVVRLCFTASGAAGSIEGLGEIWTESNDEGGLRPVHPFPIATLGAGLAGGCP